MNNLSAYVALSLVCASVSFAYLPNPSTHDGIVVQSIEGSPNQLHWSDSDLHDYRLGSDNAFVTPAAGGRDVYGRDWTSSAPSRADLGASGGTLRVIFLGSGDDGFTGATGYSYSHGPHSNGYTYSRDGSFPAPSSFRLGDFADVPLGHGDAYSFELWTVSAHAWYTLFNFSNSVPAPTPGRVTWLAEPLLVPTYIPATGEYARVPTWIVSIDEPSGASHRLAVQFFYTSGHTLEPFYGDAKLNKLRRDRKKLDPAERWSIGQKVACRD